MKRSFLWALFLAGISTSVAEAQEAAKATFAGGCFWCIEAPFDKVTGVVSAVSGYTGGQRENLMAIGKPSKTIGYSNISHQEQDSIFGERISVGSFVDGAPQNAY